MRVLAVGLTLIVTAATAAAQDGGSARRAPTKDERPEIVLRASPNLAFSPARVSLRAELRGGADDFEEYYCTTVEWIWGDGTSSEASMDCEPYEPGRSEIRRYYTGTHVYNVAGHYDVRFRMKKNDKVVGSGRTTVQVRPGIRDLGPYD